jgi:hypothetical protein
VPILPIGSSEITSARASGERPAKRSIENAPLELSGTAESRFA